LSDGNISLSENTDYVLADVRTTDDFTVKKVALTQSGVDKLKTLNDNETAEFEFAISAEDEGGNYARKIIDLKVNGQDDDASGGDNIANSVSAKNITLQFIEGMKATIDLDDYVDDIQEGTEVDVSIKQAGFVSSPDSSTNISNAFDVFSFDEDTHELTIDAENLDVSGDVSLVINYMGEDVTIDSDGDQDEGLININFTDMDADII
jgi:hypothetical protein